MFLEDKICPALARPSVRPSVRRPSFLPPSPAGSLSLCAERASAVCAQNMSYDLWRYSLVDRRSVVRSGERRRSQPNSQSSQTRQRARGAGNVAVAVVSTAANPLRKKEGRKEGILERESKRVATLRANFVTFKLFNDDYECRLQKQWIQCAYFTLKIMLYQVFFLLRTAKYAMHSGNGLLYSSFILYKKYIV